jgi:hypothetical protein
MTAVIINTSAISIPMYLIRFIKVKCQINVGIKLVMVSVKKKRNGGQILQGGYNRQKSG